LSSSTPRGVPHAGEPHEGMEKVVRVIKKRIPDAPHECLLTIDASTGQNGLIQARMFKEAVRHHRR